MRGGDPSGGRAEFSSQLLVGHQRAAGKLHAHQLGGALSMTLAQDHPVGLGVQLWVGLRELV